MVLFFPSAVKKERPQFTHTARRNSVRKENIVDDKEQHEGETQRRENIRSSRENFMTIRVFGWESGVQSREGVER